MTPNTTPRELLKYTLWADRRLMATLQEVRSEDALREAGTSHGSLLGTVAHILGAELLWFFRWVGNPIEGIPGIDQFPDFEALKAGFEELWPQLEFFLASLSEEQLQGELTWVNSRGETHCRFLWQSVTHLANHSSYHRGQAVTLLRQLGYEPPSTDLIYFFKDCREAD